MIVKTDRATVWSVYRRSRQNSVVKFDRTVVCTEACIDDHARRI